MSITKYRLHRGDISELSDQHPAFRKFNGTSGTGWHKWIDKTTGAGSYDKMILFVGKSGYGKSTTVNGLFGNRVLETSDVAACTRVCQCLEFHVENNHWLSLGDLPGVGENLERDHEYLELYSRFFEYASVIVHVLRADTRDYSIDEYMTSKLINTPKMKGKVIYALGQCDKIEPLNRNISFSPSFDQLKNINLKLREVMDKFSPKNPVVPYSAETGWNMSFLSSEIVRVALLE